MNVGQVIPWTNELRAGSGRCSGSASYSTRSGPRWTTASYCPTSTCLPWPTKRASTRPTTPSSSRTRPPAEFSYASEHVRHDTAISLLLALDRAAAKLASLAPGSWDSVREWLSARLAEVWQARGPYPGLGAALAAFGIREGTLLAYAIQSRLGDNDDPWLLADRWLRDPSSDQEASARVSPVMAKTWASLGARRRALLHLLSRFDLTIDQATRFYQPTERDKAGLSISDEELLANPYLIYERSRLTIDPVGVRVIDHGVLPENRVRASYPLPAPTAVDDIVDPRRVRALVLSVLEDAAAEGDTLRSQANVIQEIRDQPLQPGCPISPDIMGVVADALPPEVETAKMADGSAAYQLARLGGRSQADRQTDHPPTRCGQASGDRGLAAGHR